MKKIFMLIVIILLLSANIVYAATSNYKKDVENVIDKIDDFLYSSEVKDISEKELIELNRKMLVEMKKFNSKHPDTVANYNFTKIIELASNFSSELNTCKSTFGGYAVDNLVSINHDEIKQYKEATQNNKKLSNPIKSTKRVDKYEPQTKQGKEIMEMVNKK